MGTGPREAARMLRMGPNTERKYRLAFAAAGLMAGDPADLPPIETLKAAVAEHAPPRPAPQQISSLGPLSAQIRSMRAAGAGPRAIHDRLRLDDPDFKASYSAMKRFCRRLDKEEGVKPEDVAIPVETEPGEVLQVDFGYVGKLYDPVEGRLRKAWVFVAVLGYSRHMWADVVFDQKVTTWLDLHVRAFRELGGVVKTVVPDNLKAAVIRAAFGTDGPVALNKSYRELARHYGFKVDPTPPRSPEKKGKVEAGVKYVKRNYFRPRGAMDFPEARSGLPKWVAEVAGMRVPAPGPVLRAGGLEGGEGPPGQPCALRPAALLRALAADRAKGIDPGHRALDHGLRGRREGGHPQPPRLGREEHHRLAPSRSSLGLPASKPGVLGAAGGRDRLCGRSLRP
jgi:transposase